MENQNLLEHIKSIYYFSIKECQWREFSLKYHIQLTRNTYKLIIALMFIVCFFSDDTIPNISVLLTTFSLLLITTKKETMNIMKFFVIVISLGIPWLRLFLIGEKSLLYSHVNSLLSPLIVLLFSESYILTTFTFLSSIMLDKYHTNRIMQEFIQSPQSFEGMFKYYISHSHFNNFLIWGFLSLTYYHKQALFALLWSKQKEAENLYFQFQKKNEELEKTNQGKNRFFLSLSHEFRNPINAALGNLELINEKVSDPTIQKYLANANTSIGMLFHLVSNLLDTHKLECGSLEWNPLLQDSRKLLNKVWTISKSFIDKHNLIGEFYIHKKIPRKLNIDSHYLIQSLLNLIFNGIKYTQQGGIMIVLSWINQSEFSEESLLPTKLFFSKFQRTIGSASFQNLSTSTFNKSLESIEENDSPLPSEGEIPFEYTTQREQNLVADKVLKRFSIDSMEEYRHIRKNYEKLTNREEELLGSQDSEWSLEEKREIGNGYLKIEVFDSGRGIDDKVKNAIFQKYSSLFMEGQDRLGLGLGLFLTKRMCESTGGHIKAYSEKDQGSQFILTIPIEPPIEKLPSEKQLRLKNICCIKSMSQLSAFIVDDDKYNREISSLFLSKADVKVVGEATNGQEAVQRVTSKTFDGCDFILMDLEMPIMNGKEAVKRIRQYEALHQKVPTKIVIATGNVDLEEYNSCMNPDGEIRADLFYRKPLRKRDFEDIAEIIQGEKLKQSTAIVVDGDALMTEFVKTSLKKHKVHVITTETLEEGEELSRQYQSNLRWVFVHLNQPQDKLQRFVEITCSSCSTHEIEVIGFSDDLTSQQKAFSEDLGIKKLLNSPFNPAEFDLMLGLQ